MAECQIEVDCKTKLKMGICAIQMAILCIFLYFSLLFFIRYLFVACKHR